MKVYVGKSWSGRSLRARPTLFFYLFTGKKEHTLTIKLPGRTLGEKIAS